MDEKQTKEIAPEHAEAINLIRTIRAMVDCGYPEKQFYRNVLDLLHQTRRGCIGCDEEIPEQLVDYKRSNWED